MRPAIYLLRPATAPLACATLAGLMNAAQDKGITSQYGQGAELIVIAAVIVGGAAISGGRGRVLGACLGAALVVLIDKVRASTVDEAQAEQQLIAANANIGAARAARFPRIALTASAGVVSDELSGLFNGDGRTAWSFAPAVTMPLFDFGRAAANAEAATVQRDIAVAQYDKAIQTAFQDVADALVARQTYAEQADAQRAQADAEAARLRLSTLRYDTGVSSQLDLLDAQRGLFVSQQALISAQLARQQAHIAVYKALGGGWVGPAQPTSAESSATR